MSIKEINSINSHPDVNGILTLLSQRLQSTLEEDLIGLYLTGSLTYGGFERGSSDIDFLCILQRPLTEAQRQKVKNIHAHIAQSYPFWAKRIEASYITQDMLHCSEPPPIPRPYVNGGQMWNPDPPYGHEWLVNLYALYIYGVTLVGPDFKTLVDRSIEIEAVRKASRDDLHQEWKPLLHNPSALEESHFHAYSLLTLCRILYRAKHDTVASKRASSMWVKETYGKPWCDLIERAERWQHGQEMGGLDDSLKFIQFVIKELG